MATSSHAAPAVAAPVSGGGTTGTTSETIAGLYVFRIDNFSATKDLGVGKSVKSGTFNVGGHGWYVECYPCGVDEDSNGWVSLYLCRQENDHGSRVSAECKFTLMESLEDDVTEETIEHPDKHSRWGIDFFEREELESVLKDDCFHVRCTVCVWIDKLPPVPRRDQASETAGGSHVLTIHEYSKTREVLEPGDSINSCTFHVGGLSWYIRFLPCGPQNGKSSAGVATLVLYDDPPANDKVKVRFELSLLTHDGKIISSLQSFHAFTHKNDYCGFDFLGAMEHESSPLLRDAIRIWCDMVIVNGIRELPDLRWGNGSGGGLHGSQQVQVRGDVTFEVRGQLFSAHKCVLATRCTAFMAEFLGTSGKENSDVTNQHVNIEDMEPRVFEVLLHFIYTDALPEVHEDEKVVMAQGLLVAADRYALERLKLICGDLLSSYIKDPRTAVTALDLADKHGCRRLKEACMKFLMDQFANVAP